MGGILSLNGDGVVLCCQRCCRWSYISVVLSAVLVMVDVCVVCSGGDVCVVCYVCSGGDGGCFCCVGDGGCLCCVQWW